MTEATTGATTGLELSDEQLQQELARRQQAKQAEDARRAQAVLDAQTAWHERIASGAVKTEKALETKGKAAYEKAVKAVKAGNLDGAFKEYCTYQATRTARAMFRSAANSSYTRTGSTKPKFSDLSYAQVPFTEFLEHEREKAVSISGEDMLYSLIGEIPASYEDLEQA
jgi:hypothetical protein